MNSAAPHHQIPRRCLLPFLAVLLATFAPLVALAEDQAERFLAEPGSWEQILQSEQPMPMPTPELRRTPEGIPPDFTRAIEKDLVTGEETQVAVDAVRALLNPRGSVDGQPGENPEPLDDSYNPWLEEDGFTGGITPTAPQPTTDVLGFPRRATYKLRMRYGSAYPVCSATPFGPYHVITAAHCIFNHTSDFPTGWANEAWIFPAQTDLTTPTNEPDHPFGEARVTHMRTWTCWTQDANWDCDLALLTLDRRISDRTGWMGREWGVEAGSLNFNGYPTQTPYVPSGTILQYPGFDSGNVRQYSARWIRLDALIYGGHSGGPVWRYISASNARYIQGVNSTSNRVGSAHAARYRSNEETYYNESVTADNTARPPLNRPDLKEETYHHGSTHKILRTPNIGRQGIVDFRYNVFNAGFGASGTITVNFYLSSDTNITTGDRLIGTATLSSLNGNNYWYQDRQIRLPATVGAGSYYLGWTMSAANAEYTGMNYCFSAARPGCNNYGVITPRLTVGSHSDYNWTVTATAGTGGSISPAGAVTVENGLRRTFTVTPASGWRLNGVTGSCGGSMISTTQFQTSPITSNCTVTASFSLDRIFANGFQP